MRESKIMTAAPSSSHKFFCVYDETKTSQKRQPSYITIDHEYKGQIRDEKMHYEHLYVKNYEKDQEGWYQYHGASCISTRG